MIPKKHVPLIMKEDSELGDFFQVIVIPYKLISMDNPQLDLLSNPSLQKEKISIQLISF